MEKNPDEEIEKLILQFNLARIYFAEEEEEEASIVTSLRDITAQKQMEKKILDIHDIYRRTIENAHGIPYRLKYADNSYEFIGEGCEELLGIEPQKLTFLKLKDMIQEAVITDPQTPSDYNEYHILFRNGKIDRYHVELRIRTPAGQERWISDRSLPISDPKNGKVIGSIGILQDITERKRVEEALAKREAELRSLLDGSDDSVYAIDRYNQYIFVNNTHLSHMVDSGRISKKRAKKVLGKRYQELHPEKESEEFIKNVRKVFKTGKSVRYEFKWPGVKRWSSRSLSPIKDVKTDKVKSVSVISRDITERKRAEEKIYNQHKFHKLRASLWELANKQSFSEPELIREMLKKVGPELDVSRATFVKLNSDKKEYIVEYQWYTSAAGPSLTQSVSYRIASKMFGRKYVELPKDLIPGIKRYVKQHFKKNNIYSYLVVPFDDKKSPQGLFTFSECRHPRQWSQLEINTLLEMVNIVTLKSEDIRAQQALRASETRYRTVLENTGVATVIIEPDTTLSFVNQQFEKLSGYKKEELEHKKSWTEFVVEEDHGKMQQYHYERWEEPTAVPDQYEFQFKDRKGKVKNILLTIAMIPGTQKSVASLLDFTDKRQLEKQFQQAQKLEAVGQLTGGIAHDFNNLLTIIRGNAQMAESEIEQDTPLYNYIKKISKASQKAGRLTKQLLLFSRRETMVFEPLDLNRTINELLKMLKRIIVEDIKIRTELAGDIWVIEGDEGNLEQVIMNLAVNAQGAMPEGGALFLRTENVEISKNNTRRIPFITVGKYVCLTVEDTGIGMDKETQGKIFDPFFTTKDVEKGTGLGLSVVYGIVKKHNGWINVYSEKGVGTTFKLYFPASTIPIKEHEEQEIKIDRLEGGDEKVLLIEDDLDVCELGKGILEENGYQVDGVGDAAQALKQFKKRKGNYDLIISDVVLPDMNGVELVEQLQQIKSGIPVIMTSGYTEEKSKLDIIKEKQYPFIQKPLDVEKVLITIKQTLEKLKG